jgi:hypothetical protein
MAVEAPDVDGTGDGLVGQGERLVAAVDEQKLGRATAKQRYHRLLRTARHGDDADPCRRLDACRESWPETTKFQPAHHGDPQFRCTDR